MALAVGSSLGPYTISGLLGAGGMGEVYRARDTRLRRDVAIKVLHSHDASSAELRARLKREARSIAALNHPNICTIHDVGEFEGGDFLVMELIEGETLAERLKRGPFPLAEVLSLGAQMAEALHRAHRAGLVHRDLKPGNVMLTRAGVKLMDFGLARTSKVSLSGAGEKPASTVTEPKTVEGHIMGTLLYMAPEQLDGHPADTRSDLWALGATLYEMATGEHAFEGSTTASLIAAIIKGEPRPIAERVPLSPPALDRLVRTCLEKDPEARWQSAGDLARELRWLAEAGEDGAGAWRSTANRWRTRLLWAVPVTVLAVGAALFAGWKLAAARQNRGVVKSDLMFPGPATEVSRLNFSVSPDGTMLAIVLPDSAGGGHIDIRRLDDLEARELPGSRGGYMPFWSPDSRSVAFGMGGDRLVRLGLDGGVPETICRVSDFEGGDWGPNGWIVFGRDSGPIMRVRESGGAPEAVTKLDSTRHEVAHVYPDFLPDGKHFTFGVEPGTSMSSYEVRVGSIDGSPSRHLMTAHHAPRCDSHGWLVFARQRALLAQRIDPSGRRLIGSPIPMVEAPERAGAPDDPIVSLADGVLAFEPSERRAMQLVWLDRHGTPAGVAATLPPPLAVMPVISPDGRWAVVHRVQGGETWLVRVDLQTGAEQRLTSDEEWNSYPIWSAKGDHLIYGSTAGSDPYEIRTMDPGYPATTHTLLGAQSWSTAVAITPDGKQLVIVHERSGSKADLMYVDMNSPGTEHPYATSSAFEMDAALFANGTAAAFVSNVTGRFEIYIDDFPVRHHTTQITHNGCLGSTWSRHCVWAVNGELVYCSRDGHWVRSVRPERVDGRWVPRDDHALFPLPYESYGFCPSPDGSRFLVVVPAGGPRSASVTIVQNWKEELQHH